MFDVLVYASTDEKPVAKSMAREEVLAERSTAGTPYPHSVHTTAPCPVAHMPPFSNAPAIVATTTK